MNVWLLLFLALIAANLPWLSERVFFIFLPKNGIKPAWIRFLEWLLLYFIVGFIALGLESKLYGSTHSRDWEFYVITLCLFMIGAFPGFIYRNEFRKHLRHK